MLGAMMEGKKRESYSGGAKRAHGEAWAQEQLMVGLCAFGLEASDLEKMPKGAPEKTVLAWWLRGITRG